MKRFKKFLGVFLALAMVVGMMSVVEVKASTTYPLIETPEAKKYQSAVVDFGEKTNKASSWFTSNASDLLFEVYDSSNSKKTPNLNNITYEIDDNGELTVGFDEYELSEGDYFKFTNNAGDIKDEEASDTLLSSGSNNWVQSSGATKVIEEEEPETPTGPAGTVNSLNFYEEGGLFLEIEVTGEDDFEEDGIAYINIGEVNAKTGVVKAYITYEVQLEDGTALMDVSAYAKKGVELSVYTDDVDKARSIKIEKNADKLKATLDLAEPDISERIAITVNGKEIDDAQKLRLQARTEGSSNWDYVYDEVVDNDDESKTIVVSTGLLEDYIIPVVEQFGTTIYFRLAGEPTTTGTGADETTTYHFNSPEMKLKYPKLGKQPKVTVDYTKNIVKFPKLVQVKGIYANTTAAEKVVATTDWLDFADTAGKAGSVNISDLLADTSSDFTFYVRTKAVAKKPNSAITTVDVLRIQTAPAIGSLIVTPVPDARDATKVKNVSFKNSTGKGVEYTTSTTAGATEPESTAKWTKLANDTPKNLAATVKTIFVRFPGVNAKGKGESATAAERASGIIVINVPGLEAPVETTPSATVGNVEISGSKNAAIDSKDVVITLSDDTFKAITEDTVVTSWFTNIPTDLVAKVKTAVEDEDTTVTIEVSGTPSVASDEALSITILADVLNGGTAITVTSNTGAKFNITE